jgi:uncharacterized protein
VLFLQPPPPDPVLMRKTDIPLPADAVDRLDLLKQALAGDQRIVFAYVFGGVARGRVSPLSDVDVAFYLDGDPDSPEALLDLVGVVSDVFESDAVDVVILNSAPLSLAGRIQESAIVLVDRDPHRRHVYESLTRRMFWDFQIKERQILEARYRRHG